VQWLASKGDKQAMAPENELQWKVYTILSSRGLVQSSITANKILLQMLESNMYDKKMIRPEWQHLSNGLTSQKLPCNMFKCTITWMLKC